MNTKGTNSFDIHLPQRAKERIQIMADYRRGNDTVILFIHGLGCSKETWQDLWNREEFTNFTLIAPDLIGFGESTKSENFSYTMEEHANSLRALLDSFPHKQLYIVAHSMGGAIGILLSEKVEPTSFINIDGNLIPQSGGLLSRKTTEQSYHEFTKHGFEKLRNKLAQSNEKGAQLWVAQSNQCSPYAFYKSAQSLIQWGDSGKLLQKYRHLRIPKWYIYGEKASHMEVLEYLDLQETRKIEKSGHFVMNDNPHAFYSWLSTVI